MKKFLMSLLVICTVFSSTIINSFAIESQTNNTENYYDEYGNYENPETGEYFRWTDSSNSRAFTNVKNFEFKIRYSVKTGYFKLTDPKVRVILKNVHFAYNDGSAASCCSKHYFSIDLKKYDLTTNYESFTAPYNGTKIAYLGGGFSTSANYLLKITNEDECPVGVYLVGYGSVECYPE